MKILDRFLLVGALCLAVSLPALTHGHHDDDEGDDCGQAAGSSSNEVLSMNMGCSLEGGVSLEIEATGDIGNIGEAHGAGPIASCSDFINGLLSQTEGCIAGSLEDIYMNGGLFGTIICSGDRNQVVSDLTTILVGIQTPSAPISVISQPAVPATLHRR